MSIVEILESARHTPLSKEEIVTLLNIDNYSEDFFRLLSEANACSRKEYHGKGYVFLQIGLDCTPCSGNCKFCSFGSTHYALPQCYEKTEAEILDTVQQGVAQGVDAIFLMTSAEYDPDRFLDIAGKVKALLPPHVLFVANTGDFDLHMAQRLKEVGFTGVYHIVRLNEGIDTDIAADTRIATLDAIQAAGLDLIYCVEPIGPEHTYDQIAEEILRARAYNVDIMACMRRVAVEGTPLFEKGEISDAELTKIVAVTRIAANPKTSMNVHEPNAMAMLAGVNQLYAEVGGNPRDRSSETQTGRGYSVEKARNMLKEYGYQ